MLILYRSLLPETEMQHKINKEYYISKNNFQYFLFCSRSIIAMIFCIKMVKRWYSQQDNQMTSQSAKPPNSLC